MKAAMSRLVITRLIQCNHGEPVIRLQLQPIAFNDHLTAIHDAGNLGSHGGLHTLSHCCNHHAAFDLT
jgi:hypothetical protein